MHRRLAALLSGVAAMCAPTSLAHARSEIVGIEAFDADLDLRVSALGGETGWLDGGFGKLREGGSDRGTKVRARVAAADLTWKPRFSYAVSGVVTLTHQNGQSSDVDISQAWLNFRTGPAPTRAEIRAGIFWPPVSQEHGGSNWGVLDTITPSAANTWIAEEVQVLGLEGTLEHHAGEHTLSLTGALFRHNDMSGTLLTNRGWALHDLRITPHSDLPLPPLPAEVAALQAPITTPWLELDNKFGYYARAEWRPPLPLLVNAFRYDNLGDRTSSRDKQTSWRTRFWNLGALLSLDDKTVAKAQFLWGNTLVGPTLPFGIPVDIDFSTAYLLVGREIASGKLSARGDWFRTSDKGFAYGGNSGERGWAGTVAYKFPITKHVEGVGEVIHADSSRPGRELYGGIDEDQSQTMVQASLRFGF